MSERRFVMQGQEISIHTEPGKARLWIDGEEVPLSHEKGERPFGSQFYPHVHFDSLETLAKALIQHRFPGGAR